MRELRAGKNNVAGEKREEKKARGTRDILTVRHARHAAASDSGTGVERREPCRPGELAVLPRVPQDHRANLDSYSPFAKANPKPSPLLKVRNKQPRDTSIPGRLARAIPALQVFISNPEFASR